ncbi:MAG: hypothetical protein JRN09_04150 [Nitrososphaerota archaeon]|nr:hypothetical protein [Nitrososphaerota archaeon]
MSSPPARNVKGGAPAPTAAPGNAELLFTELVDAVRYSQNWKRILEEQGKAKSVTDVQTEELDELGERISKTFDGLHLDPADAKSLSGKIGEFAALAIQQTKDRVSAKLKTTLEDLTAELNSEELKAKKSLESYLATSPLPVVDEEVTLELADGSYSATLEHRCSGEIEYEFLLNTASSELFRREVTFANIQKGLKLPVRLGKAWLRKEPVADFERLDAYALSKARASKSHLTATFSNHETKDSVEMVFSRSGAESFVTIGYYSGGNKVDVTGEAALSKHIDLVSVKQAMGRLVDAIIELKKNKLQLSKLECDGNDVLLTLDCLSFMQRVVTILGQSKESMQEIRRVDPKFALERLKLLGPISASLSSTLGLSETRS